MELSFTRKTLTKMLILLCCSVMIGLLLLVIVYTVPNGHITRHVEESVGLLRSEGTHPALSGYDTTTRNNWGDGDIMLSIISNRGIHPLDEAINNYHLQTAEGHNDSPKDEQLIAYFASENKEDYIQYPHSPRYWHGIHVVARTLFFFFDLATIRMILMISQTALMFIAMYLLQKRLAFKYSIAYFTALIMLSPCVLFMCLEQSVVFTIMLLSSIVILLKHEWLEKHNRYILLFFLIGIMIAYFDYLTYPLVAWGLPLVITLLLSNKDSTKINLRNTVVLSISWLSGYALMWGSKWLVRSLYMGTNCFREAIEQIVIRTSSTNSGLSEKVSYMFEAIRRNLAPYNAPPYLLLLACIIVVIIALLLARKIKVRIKQSSGLIVPLVFIAFVPFVWYCCLANHSMLHGWLCTHRNLSVSVFSLFCLLFSFLSPARGRASK